MWLFCNQRLEQNNMGRLRSNHPTAWSRGIRADWDRHKLRGSTEAAQRGTESTYLVSYMNTLLWASHISHKMTTYVVTIFNTCKWCSKRLLLYSWMQDFNGAVKGLDNYLKPITCAHIIVWNPVSRQWLAVDVILSSIWSLLEWRKPVQKKCRERFHFQRETQSANMGTVFMEGPYCTVECRFCAGNTESVAGSCWIQ